MTTRERLPDRREGEAIEIEHVWSPGTEHHIAEMMLVRIGRYADGRIGEVFINYPNRAGERKKSERVIALGHDVATLLSIALQYGAPVEVLRAAMGRAEVNLMGQSQMLPHTIIGTVLDVLAAEGGPQREELEEIKAALDDIGRRIVALPEAGNGDPRVKPGDDDGGVGAGSPGRLGGGAEGRGEQSFGADK